MGISKLVTDGVDTWLETRQYYFYSKHEAQKAFKKYVKSMGWRLA